MSIAIVCMRIEYAPKMVVDELILKTRLRVAKLLISAIKCENIHICISIFNLLTHSDSHRHCDITRQTEDKVIAKRAVGC